MLVKILKSGAWSFSDGRITLYDADTVEEVEQAEAERMIESGFAVDESTSSEIDWEARRDYYKKRYSRTQLMDFCRRFDIEFKTSETKTIADFLDKIEEFEKKNGIIPKEKINE